MKIGVLGAGQLGRMLALAGYRLGMDFIFLDPAEDACAAPLGPQIRADYEDEQALADFCSRIDVATYEFENVPAATAEFVANHKPLLPGPRALAVGQDRLAEKQMFDRLGIHVPRYAPVSNRGELDRAVAAIGLPAVVKTRRLGYDGKGQAVLRTPADVDAAWEQLGTQPLLIEAFVPFEREISCIGVRSANKAIAFYPVAENTHRDGILRTSIPRLGDPLQGMAEECTRLVMERLDYVGVLAFEFFVQNGQLAGNEIAPRVHNSGHWTIDGAQCSQFENHLRAITGLPLGATEARGHCAMVNFIGEIPEVKALSKIPGLQLHLYGKKPKPARKVGHATITAPNPRDLQASLEAVTALINA